VPPDVPVVIGVVVVVVAAVVAVVTAVVDVVVAGATVVGSLSPRAAEPRDRSAP